jgi:tetratricopeptide (TPR) repeat protein
MGVFLGRNSEFEDALYHLEKVLEINVAANSLWGISTSKSTIVYVVYQWQGKIDLAYRTSAEALQMADESGDMFSKAMAYSVHGYSCYCKGFLDEAEAYSLKGVDYSERINFSAWIARSYYNLAETYFDREEYPKSRDCSHKQFSIYEHAKFFSPGFINQGKIGFARAKVMNNERDIDLQSLYEVEDGNLSTYEGWMLRCIGEILLNIDDQHMNEGEDWVKKAIKTDEKNGVMFNLGRDYVLYAELFKRKGDKPKARENLKKAIEIMKECGADGWVEKYEKELAALS